MRVPCNNLCACRIARTTEPKEAAKVARWDHRWSQPQLAHRVGKELAVDPSRHGEVISPPHGLRGAIVLGVVAQHNVRPLGFHQQVVRDLARARSFVLSYSIMVMGEVVEHAARRSTAF